MIMLDNLLKSIVMYEEEELQKNMQKYIKWVQELNKQSQNA